MPAFDDNMEEFEGAAGGFKFSGVSIDELDEESYTLGHLVVDITGSVYGWQDQLLHVIKESVRGCRRAPRADNLLVRVTTFNEGVYETHGWKPLSQIDEDNDYPEMDPNFQTALFDATIDGLEAMSQYAAKMKEPPNYYSANGVLIIVTDGDNNKGTVRDPKIVGDKLAEVIRSENLESVIVILVGVNVTEQYYKEKLTEFKEEANLTKYINIEEVNDKTMAKLAEFISSSVSDTLDNLGTGDSLTEDELNIQI